ncbi:MAG TPA: LPS assembly protein LptD [Xanthomonadaceae bacterium]|nr:LPS assembly protein LptD [Xanthomonadaceae bacterium]
MRPSLRLLPLALAFGLLTIAHASTVPGESSRHKNPALKLPEDMYALCRGDAVPEFPGVAPVGRTSDRPTAPADVQADLADLSKVGTSIFEGNVEMRHADQWVFADQITYEHDQETWSAVGSVKYQDNTVRLTADRADGDRNKDITTITTIDHPLQYQLRDARGNGKGDHGKIVGDNETFMDATWSTCDPDNRKWEIHGNQIDMNRTTDVGTAHGATVKIGNVPVMYLPWFTFSLDNERKSGFLEPGFAASGHSGFMLTLPYYLNLAPNYDATFTGQYFGDRGLMLDGEFRYLTAGSKGSIDATWLPDDAETHTDRGSLDIKSTYSLTSNWYTSVDINHVSDPAYLQDFSQESFATAIGFLASTAGLYGRGRYWSAGLYVQGWQISDPSLVESEEPYRRLPDVWFRWDQPLADHFEVGFKSEAVRFDQSVLPGGTRVDLYPYIALPFDHAAWYVRPEVGYRYTTYNLDQPVVPGGNTSPTRGLPILDFDAGAYFERDTTLFGHDFVNTLEPRLFYLYVPYRNQDDIPIFDTQDYTYAFQQLFRTNSFPGADRQSDANQLTAAVTTRLLDADDGREWLTTSFGQIHYFQAPRVQLPGQPYLDISGTDYVLDNDVALDDHWTIGTENLYDPNNSQTDLAAIHGQYKFGQSGVINAAYRYRRDLVREADTSFVYPLNENWRLVGAWDYSLLDRSTLEGLAGVEWEDCCMAVRTYVRNYIRNTAGEKDTAVFVELDLKGIGSLGRDTSNVLDHDILGYSR